MAPFMQVNTNATVFPEPLEDRQPLERYSDCVWKKEQHMAVQTRGTDQSIQFTLDLLDKLLSGYTPRDFAIRLWDGTVREADIGQPTRFTIIFQHPGALRQMFLPPTELALGEAYIYNDFDIEGDITAVVPLADSLLSHPLSLREQMHLGSQLMRLPRKVATHTAMPQVQGALHSKARDRSAVTYHYDQSNEFYALWLDSRMVYSCAYFQTPDDDLDTAQEHKLEYICRKLRLQPGEHLLDIGCGWGGLLIYAAEHYGVQADGITLSQSQAALAQERIHRAGLDDRCHVEVRDYRDLSPSESYDKLVSVGMFEHVGAAKLPFYFQQAWRLLRPGGVFLNHGIAATSDTPIPKKSFVNTYVFPDGELVRLNTTLRAAEASQFEVRDVESLREHYALTLMHWVHNLETHADEAKRLTDDITYRIWRLYMAGAINSFRTGQNTIFQTLLAKPDQGHSGLPLTRSDWYEKT
jgi:cyclopropane-fatty-acyl-phospholipid synthase